MLKNCVYLNQWKFEMIYNISLRKRRARESKKIVAFFIMPHFLFQTFQTRFRKVMDSSQNSYNEDTTKLTQKLDESERLLFKAGQLGLNDFMRWETRETEKLSTSEMVRNHRKRKRAVLEDAS